MISFSHLLLSCPLFEGIAPDDLQGLLDCLDARQISCRKGEAILAEGEPAREMGILLRGQVQLIRTDYYGNRSIVLSIVPGELFGESFACSRAERLPLSAVATEDSDVLLLDCRRVLTTCHHACVFHSRIIFNLLQIVADRNLALHRKSLITARRTTRDKLLTYLLLQAKEANKPDFSIPFDRQELADYLEVDRSGLSAELSKLKKEGILDYYKNYFRIFHAPDGI